MDTKNLITILIFAALAVLAIWLYFKFFKIPKIKNVVFVDGSLGTGKTFYSVYLAIRLHKRAVRRSKVRRFFLRYFFNFGRFKGAWEKVEKPLLYSNIKLRNYEHVIVTKDLLFRKNYRFAYGSILLLDEMSLVADQMLFKNHEINERLSEFFKLFRHETRGGYLVFNSQTTNDLHFSAKYVLSDYLYLHSRFKVPFFSVLRMQEVGYSADGNGIQSVAKDDIETTLRYVLVPNRYYKYYDTYCHSIFTDGLAPYKKVCYYGKGASLKSDLLVSFKDFKYLYENLEAQKAKEKEIAKNEAEKKESK